MIIEIYNESDRLTVAAILVKNGYRVNQDKAKKNESSKSYVYFLDAEKKNKEVTT